VLTDNLGSFICLFKNGDDISVLNPNVSGEHVEPLNPVENFRGSHVGKVGRSCDGVRRGAKRRVEGC